MPDVSKFGRQLAPAPDRAGITDADAGTVLAQLQSGDTETTISIQEVVDIISQVRKKVLLDWERLKGIVERHEATLRKRWMKSVAKRQELLLQVWPHIPPMHRPDFIDYSNYGSEQRTSDAARDGLWPYINLEGLTDRKSLVFFINSRGRHHPSTLGFTEVYYCPSLSMYLDMKADGCLSRYVVHLGDEYNTAVDLDTYGCVFELLTGHSACEWETRGHGYPLTLGLLTLQIQQGIYDFLCKCCKLILHEMPPQSLLSDMYSVEQEPPSILEHEEISSSFAEGAKRSPPSPT